MSRMEKRLENIRRRVRNVSLIEFEALIKAYGIIEEGTNHPKAIVGTSTMPYKRENPVKSCYVRELLDLVDSYSKGGK